MDKVVTPTNASEKYIGRNISLEQETDQVESDDGLNKKKSPATTLELMDIVVV